MNDLVGSELFREPFQLRHKLVFNDIKKESTLKHRIAIITTVLLLSSGHTLAQGMSTTLVAYKDCSPDINSLEFNMKPQSCGMAEQALSFMVKGQNIALIDDKSLKFSKLTIAGKDVRFNRKGDNTFKLGAFPKIDDNGKFAIFDVELKSAPFGHIASASMAGTIDIFTSERLVKADKTALDLTKGFAIKVGPFAISSKKPEKKKANSVMGAAGKALQEGLQSVFLGDAKDRLAIYVRGNHDAIVALEVYENGRKLDSGWTSSSNNQKMYTFTRPSGSKVDLKVKYWDGLKRVTVPVVYN